MNKVRKAYHYKFMKETSKENVDGVIHSTLALEILKGHMKESKNNMVCVWKRDIRRRICSIQLETSRYVSKMISYAWWYGICNVSSLAEDARRLISLAHCLHTISYEQARIIVLDSSQAYLRGTSFFLTEG